MSKQTTILILSSFFFSFVNYSTAQTGRLESEYKLDIHNEDVNSLWKFIQDNYAQPNYELAELKLSGTQSEELFIDSYFDAPDGQFVEGEISLRHRKRFKDEVLLKELIQLKTPYSTDMVVRNELKFEVSNKKDEYDLTSRHPLLKYLGNSDRDRMAFHLAAYKLRPEEIVSALKLKQLRQRVYIKDGKDESIATITLDQVNNFSFPFQSYAELELELNEVRYTAASDEERKLMTALNNEIKTKLAQTFPRLKVDQRSKYRKMHELIASSSLSSWTENILWLLFGSIISIASLLFIKDQFS